MIVRKSSTAREASIIAISAALFAIFFFLSGLVALPRFTLLYLPIILLGVFPIWFGKSGLIGSVIGAFIGGAYIEGLGLFGWIESVTAFIIYGLNWLLITRQATEVNGKRNLALLLSTYAVTLFAGTSYILWQNVTLGFFTPALAEIIFLPTFALNLAIQCIVCPILIRTLSPKLKSVGMYSGTFKERQTQKPKLPTSA
jgi:hypothetical protein